jgi:hypothetical protein
MDRATGKTKPAKLYAWPVTVVNRFQQIGSCGKTHCTIEV